MKTQDIGIEARVATELTKLGYPSEATLEGDTFSIHTRMPEPDGRLIVFGGDKRGIWSADIYASAHNPAAELWQFLESRNTDTARDWPVWDDIVNAWLAMFAPESRQPLYPTPENKFVHVHTHEIYRDYEPQHGLVINGWTSITFNDEDHTAYATLVNPAGLDPNGTEPITNGETVPLSTEEALKWIVPASSREELLDDATNRVGTALGEAGMPVTDKVLDRVNEVLAKLFAEIYGPGEDA
jgi:hypothetical protein